MAKLGHVDSFNTQTHDWNLYVERLGQYFVANDVTTDAKKVAILLTVMGSKAYELVSASGAVDEQVRRAHRNAQGSPEPQTSSDRGTFQVPPSEPERGRDSGTVHG